MRFPDLTQSVVLGNGQKYTMANLLNEFCWGSGVWSAEESIPAFTRLTAALKVEPVAFADDDFKRVADHLRNLNFPSHAAIELTELRNAFVMSPSEQK